MSACRDCSATLGARNTSGFCKRCLPKRMALDPDVRRRQREGIRRKFEDPEYREQHIARCIANGKNVSDEVRARRVEHGRYMASTKLNSPEVRARWRAGRADAGRKRSETVMGWCPPEWRDTYRELKKRGRTAAVARRIVIGMMNGKPHELYAHQKSQLAWCPAEWRSRYQSLRRQYGADEARTRLEKEMLDKQRASLPPSVAAAYLKPYAPVYRCDERGRQATFGAYWRYGSAVLSNDDLIDRALRKGWQPTSLAA